MTEKDYSFIKQDWEKRIMTYPGMTREEAEDCLKLAVSLVEKGLESLPMTSRTAIPKTEGIR